MSEMPKGKMMNKEFELSTHDICVAAFIAMYRDGATKHITYIDQADLVNSDIGLKEGGRIPKVTIEWVDAKEAQQ